MKEKKSLLKKNLNTNKKPHIFEQIQPNNKANNHKKDLIKFINRINFNIVHNKKNYSIGIVQIMIWLNK